VAAPWLGQRDDLQKKVKWSTTQIATNDSARTIVGAKQSNRLSLHGLLAHAEVDSVNAHIVRAVVSETWTAFHSSDGDGGERNPLGLAMFGKHGCSQVDTDDGRSSRAKTAGKVPVNLHGSDCRPCPAWTTSLEFILGPEEGGDKRQNQKCCSQVSGGSTSVNETNIFHFSE
jgi:hypothetical protein